MYIPVWLFTGFETTHEYHDQRVELTIVMDNVIACLKQLLFGWMGHLALLAAPFRKAIAWWSPPFDYHLHTLVTFLFVSLYNTRFIVCCYLYHFLFLFLFVLSLVLVLLSRHFVLSSCRFNVFIVQPQLLDLYAISLLHLYLLLFLLLSFLKLFPP